MVCIYIYIYVGVHYEVHTKIQEYIHIRVHACRSAYILDIGSHHACIKVESYVSHYTYTHDKPESD